jgi:GxxExxY protein
MERREPNENLDRLAHDVIGAAIEVHRNLAPGFLESVYEEALCIELDLREIPFERQVNHGIDYKGHRVGDGQLDIVVGKRLVVELKAVESLAPIHTAHVISYLKATGCQLALLINFNVSVLKEGIKRVILS